MQKRQPILQPTCTDRQRVARRPSGMKAASTKRPAAGNRYLRVPSADRASVAGGREADLVPLGQPGAGPRRQVQHARSRRPAGRTASRPAAGRRTAAGRLAAATRSQLGQGPAEQVLLGRGHLEVDLRDDVREGHAPVDQQIAHLDHHPGAPAQQVAPAGRKLVSRSQPRRPPARAPPAPAPRWLPAGRGSTWAPGGPQTACGSAGRLACGRPAPGSCPRPARSAPWRRMGPLRFPPRSRWPDARRRKSPRRAARRTAGRRPAGPPGSV